MERPWRHKRLRRRVQPGRYYNAGRITGSYATGSVHADGAFFQNNAGGFSGQAHNTIIEGCRESGDVSVGNYGRAINVAGGSAGGLYDGSAMTRCYATGSSVEYGYASIGMIGGFVASLRNALSGTLWYSYASYKLPILRGVGEAEQEARPMPRHLTPQV